MSTRPATSFEARNIAGKRVLPYKYEPLHATDTVRVLELGSNQTLLECQIKEISFVESGYQALSYVWGSLVKPSEALVRDQDGSILGYIPLTANLENALRDLRDCTEIKSKTFWIDQICIHQANEREKGHQVSIMRDIYGHASRVITYTGPSSDDPQLEKNGIDLLSRLDDHFHENYEKYYECGSPELIVDTLSELPKTQLPLDLQNPKEDDIWVWRWLVEVAYGNWTQRLWIVQEQLLNLEVPVILRGPQLISWDAVAMINLLFHLDILPEDYVIDYWHLKHSSNPKIWISPSEVTDVVFSMWHSRKKMKKKDVTSISSIPPSENLITNLSWYESLQCENPRDRVFALLGISSDVKSLGIVPDYTKPVIQIFLETSVSLLMKSETLEPLTLFCVWDSESDPSLPSWALKIPQSREQQSRIMRFLDNDERKTHPCTETKLRFGNENRTLIVKGCQVSSIAVLTPPNPYGLSIILELDSEEGIEQLSCFLENVSELFLQMGVSLRNALSFCACLTQLPEYNPSSTSSPSHQQYFVHQFWCDWRRKYNDVQTLAHEYSLETVSKHNLDHTKEVILQLAGLLLSDEDLPLFNPNSDLFPEEEEASDQIRGQMSFFGRSLGTTSCGQVFCAQGRVQKGDVIMAIEGSSDRLWTLRPVGNNQYRLVGDIYVDGFMEGEIYRDKNPDKVDYDIHIV